MASEVRPLPIADPAVAGAVVELQRAAYRVEAELIGADGIPALTETPEQLARSGERFLGVELDGRLAGAVAYRRTGDAVDVHRLVVHPGAFRRGLATALLDALERTEATARRWTVSTAAANAPARALYEARGFVLAGESMAGAIALVHYAR